MDQNLDLSAKIEGLLFYKGEDVKISKLSEIFSVSEEEVKKALEDLGKALFNRGLVIVYKDDSVVLGINSKLSPIINGIRKEEVNKDLSKASLETLSIVLYKNGVTRSEIDYIRGVNSSFILRNLLVRGLIERFTDASDTRRIIYKPSFDLLSYMGVTSVDKIPNFTEIKKQLEDLINNTENNND